MDLFELIGWSGKTIETLTDDEYAELQTRIINKNKELSENKELAEKNRKIPVDTLLTVFKSINDMEAILYSGMYSVEELESLNLIERSVNLRNFDFIRKYEPLIALERINWGKINFKDKNPDDIVPFILRHITEIDFKDLSNSNISQYCVERLSTHVDFKDNFDYVNYLSRNKVDLSFLLKYKTLINWNEFSKTGIITKELLRGRAQENEIIELLNLDIILARDDIDKEVKIRIEELLSKRKQDAIKTYNELINGETKINETGLEKWAELGYDPRILVNISENVRGLFLEAAINGLDVKKMAERLEKIPNVTRNQVKAYMYGLKHGIDLNFKVTDTVPVMLARIENGIEENYLANLFTTYSGKYTVTKNQAKSYMELQELKEQMLERGMPDIKIPDRDTDAAVIAEFVEAVEYNLNLGKDQTPISLEILQNSNFNALQMKLYRLLWEQGIYVEPSEITAMYPKNVEAYINLIENKIDVSEYLIEGLHHKELYKKHPEAFQKLKDELNYKVIIDKFNHIITTLFPGIITKERAAKIDSIIDESIEDNATEENSEENNKKEETTEEEKTSTTEESTVKEESSEEKTSETKKETTEESKEDVVEESKPEEVVEDKKEEEEKTEPVETLLDGDLGPEIIVEGRGKITTEKDIKVTKIQLDKAVVEINNEIAMLVRSTLLTQEEFDSLSWLQLSDRFGRDVEQLNRAISILEDLKSKGVRDLDYIDMDSLISLRDKKLELQADVISRFGVNSVIHSSHDNIDDTKKMISHRAKNPISEREANGIITEEDGAPINYTEEEKIVTEEKQETATVAENSILAENIVDALVSAFDVTPENIEFIDSGENELKINIGDTATINLSLKENDKHMSYFIEKDTTGEIAESVASYFAIIELGSPNEFKHAKSNLILPVKEKSKTKETESKAKESTTKSKLGKTVIEMPDALQIASKESEKITSKIKDKYCSIFTKEPTPEDVKMYTRNNKITISVKNNEKDTRPIYFNMPEIMEERIEGRPRQSQNIKNMKKFLQVHKVEVGHLYTVNRISDFKKDLKQKLVLPKKSNLDIKLNVDYEIVDGKFNIGEYSVTITGNFDSKNPKRTQTLTINNDGVVNFYGEAIPDDVLEVIKGVVTVNDSLIPGFVALADKYNIILEKNKDKTAEDLLPELRSNLGITESPIETKVSEETKENMEASDKKEDAEKIVETEKPVESQEVTKENTFSPTQAQIDARLHNMKSVADMKIKEVIEKAKKGGMSKESKVKKQLDCLFKPEEVIIDGVKLSFTVDTVRDKTASELVFEPKITIKAGDKVLYSDIPIATTDEETRALQDKLSVVAAYIENHKTAEKTTEPEVNKNNRDEETR